MKTSRMRNEIGVFDQRGFHTPAGEKLQRKSPPDRLIEEGRSTKLQMRGQLPGPGASAGRGDDLQVSPLTRCQRRGEKSPSRRVAIFAEFTSGNAISLPPDVKSRIQAWFGGVSWRPYGQLELQKERDFPVP